MGVFWFTFAVEFVAASLTNFRLHTVILAFAAPNLIGSRARHSLEVG